MNEKIKKEPKYMNHARKLIVDDSEDIYTILDMTARDLNDNFDIKASHPEMILTAFDLTFRAFRTKLEERRNAGYNRYKIIIANRLEFGFDDTVGDYEKNGGFVVYYKHLYHEAKDDDSNREYEDNTITLCTTWQSINITSDSQIIKEVAAKSVEEYNKYDIATSAQEVVLPIFCTVYDNIISYIKLKRATENEFEYSISFAGLFDIKAIQSNDLDDIIEITPSIDDKTTMKSDDKASSKHDD